MSTPFFDLIEELRALAGAPKVTYPTGNNSYPQTERTLKCPRGTETLALGSPEPDTARFPNNKLTDQISLRMDAQYVEVYRKYEVLPGPFTKQGQDYDPEYGFLSEYTEGEVKNGAAIGTATSDIEPINYIKSNLKTYTVPTAALNSFYMTFPGMEEIELPKVLAGVLVTWDIATGGGSFSEGGSGFAVGASASLSLSAQGKGQGSASALGDITPVFAPHPQGQLPVLDYFFFLPNPVTLSAILTRATAIATALAGSSVTVNQWPVFMGQSHTFIICGQKASVSQEATAKCSVSLLVGSGDSPPSVSESTSTGAGANVDMGSNVKAVTIPECIHGAIDVIGFTQLYAIATATASAVIKAGVNWPGANSSPAAVNQEAIASVNPVSLAATPVAALPTSGLYLYKPDVAPYKWGYSTVRARIFDFSVLTGTVSLGQPQITVVDFNGLTGASFVKSAQQISTVNFTGLTGANFVTTLPQITTVDFTGLTGATFATAGAGLGFLLPSTGSTVYGVWFNTGGESQPTLAGATTYLEVTISPSGAGSTAAQIAASLVTAIGTISTIFTAASVGAVTTITSVARLAQTAASDVNSTAVITVTQTGSINNPGLGFLLPSSSTSLGTFGVWFNTGTEAQPAITGALTYVKVTISPTATASAIATALAAAFSGYTALWTVGAASAIVTFTSVSFAAQGNASDVNSGAVITVTQEGGAAVGNYFLIYGYQVRATAIWFNAGNEIAPTVLGSTIQVAISPTATAAAIAAAVVSAVPAQVGAVWVMAQINGGGANTAAQFTSVANQTTTNAADVDTGAAITTTQAGAPPNV